MAAAIRGRCYSPRAVELYACPFCRQMFARGEVNKCPECGLAVQPLAELPPSAEAEALDAHVGPPPEEETLHWSYAGRARGPLVLLALTGLGVFVFAPWLDETAPEIRVLTGVQFARLLPWLWGGGVAWIIMLALVLSRRTIVQMRGARLAVGLMAAMALSTVTLRIAMPLPQSRVPIPRHFQWGWGMYASAVLALAALVYAWRFGGTLEDMPSGEQRPRDETLH
jgi:hypothetical protein